MKKIFIYLFAILLAAIACHKEYTIYPYAKLEQCLTPTELRAKVFNLTVTFDWKAYPDAKTFYVEIYNRVPGEGEEPDHAALVDSLEFPASQLPYEYRGPKDTRCYYRVKAKNPECKDSRWASGTFKTDVDPEITCSTPTDLKATAIGEMVVFTWDLYPNTTRYELEIYDKYFPADEEPDPANRILADTLQRAEVPDTVWLEPNVKRYFRVKGSAPGTTLEDSKWVTGSFETSVFVWPTDTSALSPTAVTTQNYKGYDNDGNASPFTGSNKPTTKTITLNKFTYGHKGTFWGNRIGLAGTAQASDFDTEYGAPIPSKNYLSFKIVTPGLLKTYFLSTVGADACVVLVTTKLGEGKRSRYVYRVPSVRTEYYSAGMTQDEITIKKGDLYGITEAATVYVYAPNYKALHVYQMEWTPSNQ